jgi:hypothetical protein
MTSVEIIRAALAGLVVAIVAGPAAADGDAVRGQILAEQHCARCHRISSSSTRRGLDNVPSFPLLVRKRPDFRERFATFYTRRPHPAYVTVKGDERRLAHLPATAEPIELEAGSVADLIAFAQTLKSEK